MDIRVLIVDDYAASRTILRTVLAAFKVEADEAATLEEARASIASHRYDAIFIDLFLGGERGEALLMDFAGSVEGDRPLLVIVSADPPAEGVMLAGPFDAVIGKPINVARLPAIIKRMRERRRQG